MSPSVVAYAGNGILDQVGTEPGIGVEIEGVKDARLTIPTPALLQKAVDGLDAIPMKDRDTKGDVYEYMLSKIVSAGENGQFRTPRHIIQLMVEMMAPTPSDIICDPASGTSGFLVAAAEYIRHEHPTALTELRHPFSFHLIRI